MGNATSRRTRAGADGTNRTVWGGELPNKSAEATRAKWQLKERAEPVHGAPCSSSWRAARHACSSAGSCSGLECSSRLWTRNNIPGHWLYHSLWMLPGLVQLIRGARPPVCRAPRWCGAEARCALRRRSRGVGQRWCVVDWVCPFHNGLALWPVRQASEDWHGWEGKARHFARLRKPVRQATSGGRNKGCDGKTLPQP